MCLQLATYKKGVLAICFRKTLKMLLNKIYLFIDIMRFVLKFHYFVPQKAYKFTADYTHKQTNQQTNKQTNKIWMKVCALSPRYTDTRVMDNKRPFSQY